MLQALSSSCLFTYFHVLLLFMVLNIHHINLNLYEIPLIIFLFSLLAVPWFLLAVFQHFWSSENFAFLCLDTFVLLLSNFKCLLCVMRKLGSYMASTIACCRQFLRLLYLFFMEKNVYSLSHLLYVILLLQNLSKN